MYRIVLGESVGKLEGTVKGLMSYGWYPIGGVSYDQDGFYMQAMVRYRKELYE